MKNSKVCIDACLACMIECEKCAISCLTMAGHQECVKLCRDCADICDLQMFFVQFVYNVVRLVQRNVRNMQTMPLVARLVAKRVESVWKPVKCRK
jgi:hypothetical protein